MPETLPVFASMIVSTCVLFKQRKKAALSVSPVAPARATPDPHPGRRGGAAGSRRLHRAPAARRPAADPNSAKPNKKLPRERLSHEVEYCVLNTESDIRKQREALGSTALQHAAKSRTSRAPVTGI